MNMPPPEAERMVLSEPSDGDPLRISEDELNHGKDIYFHRSLAQYGFMLPTIIASVLANGLNNSILNQQHPCELPKPQELVLLPQELPHLSPSWNFIKIAKMVDYESRIQGMLVEASE
jgi:hypothetical protein